MAVTKGHGNPAWTRDETLLALALYFKKSGVIPGPSDPEIAQLSRLLRSLPIHKDAAKRETFRNPDGVAFKLQNIRQVATGHGLGNTSQEDKAVWADYGDKPQEVRRIAEEIVARSAAGEVTLDQVALVDENEEFAEGRVLTALHRRRERDARLRSRLIAARIQQNTMFCEACGEGPKALDESLQTAGFEAHHVLPLAETGARATRVSDLALLCATCHRLIHRAMSARRRWMPLAEFRTLLHRRPTQHP